MTLNLMKQLVFLIALTAIGAIIGVADAKSVVKISGGVDAEPGVYTWVVSIGVKIGSLRPDHLCMGAIITSRHILTAGHCVYSRDPSKLSVRGGITYLWDDDNAVGADVSQIITHNDFVPEIPGLRSAKNDIAVLVLQTELSLGERVTIISLPISSPPDDGFGVVACWGNVIEEPEYVRTLTLKIAAVEYLSGSNCFDLGGIPSNGFYCGRQRSENILKVDDGTPLTSGGSIVGIASASFAVARYRDLYTNVYSHLSWIQSKIT